MLAHDDGVMKELCGFLRLGAHTGAPLQIKSFILSGTNREAGYLLYSS